MAKNPAVVFKDIVEEVNGRLYGVTFQSESA